jgi:hypothetical protein
MSSVSEAFCCVWPTNNCCTCKFGGNVVTAFPKVRYPPRFRMGCLPLFVSCLVSFSSALAQFAQRCSAGISLFGLSLIPCSESKQKPLSLCDLRLHDPSRSAYTKYMELFFSEFFYKINFEAMLDFCLVSRHLNGGR